MDDAQWYVRMFVGGIPVQLSQACYSENGLCFRLASITGDEEGEQELLFTHPKNDKKVLKLRRKVVNFAGTA